MEISNKSSHGKNDQTTFIDSEMESNKKTFFNIKSKLTEAPQPKLFNKNHANPISAHANQPILYQD